MKILYTTDLHGNMWKYKQLKVAASEQKPDIIINGGDMMPTDDHNIMNQGKFIETQLAEQMKYFGDQGIYYLCLPGNHDLPIFDSLFEETCKKYPNAFFLDNRKIKIKDYEFIGMGLIVDFPFDWKDRCRMDDKNYTPMEPFEKAVISEGTAMKEIKDWVGYIKKLATIEDELKKLVRPDNMANTIYVMHMPPSKIGLGFCDSDLEDGSNAIYEFLKLNQPKMSLHGHVHGSPEISGKWHNSVGKTVCIQPGQTEGFIYAVINLDTMEYNRFVV